MTTNPRPSAAPPLRVVWSTRSFLDYRVPVFTELDRLLDGRLHVLYSGDYVPESVQRAASAALGDRAEALRGEWSFGREDRDAMANRNFSLRIHPGVYRRIRALQPDVLIGDGFFKWTVPALLARWRMGTPLVLTYERTAHTERGAQWLRTGYRRCVLRLTDAMNCSGSLCRAYAESLGVPSARIRTGHMVADVPRLQRERAAVTAAAARALRQQWGATDLLLLCVGRLIPRKGCRELLHAWTAFERRHPSATLVFVGDGEQAAELDAYIQQQRLQGVRLARQWPHDAIASAYAAADALVMPTLEDNWSLVVPEAMACGLPVACSRYNGVCPDLVESGLNGWVFDPLVPADVDRMLETLWLERASLRSLGAEAQRRVQAHTPVTAAQSLLETCQLARQQRVC